MSQTREIKLSWKALNAAYNVDWKTVAQIAEEYGITWTEAKAALHGFGFTVRKGEIRPDEPASAYKIVLDDDRPEAAKKKVKATTAPVTTATATTPAV